MTRHAAHHAAHHAALHATYHAALHATYHAALHATYHAARHAMYYAARFGQREFYNGLPKRIGGGVGPSGFICAAYSASAGLSAGPLGTEARYTPS
jgi:hypothetical protein